MAGKLKFEVLATIVAFTNLWGCLNDEATSKFLKNWYWAPHLGFCIFSRQQNSIFEFLAPKGEITEKTRSVQPPTIPPTLVHLNFS